MDYKNYFLGLVSAEDAESLELQIISDEKLEAELLQAENNLIEDFLDGNLTSEETKAFNANFLATEERRERVEFVKIMAAYAKNLATTSAPIMEDKPSFFEQVKSFLSPRKFAFGFGGIALILTIGFLSYLGWNNYSGRSEVLVSLNKAYKNDRPTEARISGFDYAPKTEGTRGNSDKTQDLNLVLARSRATEAVLQNETAENLHQLGRVYLAEKNFDEAIKQFEKAIKKNPNIAETHNDLGVALMEKAKQKEEGKLELFAKANEEIEKSIELDKNLTAAYFNRGLVIESLNLPNQAKEAWENYLKLDSTSQWADEARQHLQKLEENKPISKTKEEILQEFLQAKQANDTEKAWQVLSRNREMITGKLIPQQLAFLFVDSKASGDEPKAKEALEALVYAGKLEVEKSGDLFWRDLAEFYANVSDDKVPTLKQAQDAVRKGYDLCVQSNFKDALTLFSKSQNLLESTSNLLEAKISQHFVAYCLTQTDKINESISLRKQIEKFTNKKKYKWLELTNFFRMGGDLYELNRYSLAEEKYKQSLVLANEVEDDYSLQRILSALAETKSIFNETGNALNYLHKALFLSNKSVSKRQYWRNLTTAVRILSRANFLDTARSFSAETINLSDELNDSIFMTNARLYLGQINSQTGHFIEADKWLNEAKQKADQIQDAKLRATRTASIILASANSNRKQGNLENSVILYREALETYNKTQFSLNVYETQKGLLLSYSKSRKDLDLENQIPLVLDLARNNRQEILNEQQINSFFDNEQDIYDIGIDHEFNKANFTNAFDYSEESRSRSLFYLQNSVVQVSDYEKMPEIKFSTNLSEPLKLAQIQSEMSENAQLLVYSVLPDAILIWAVTKEGLNTAKVEISADILQDKIATYTELLSKNTESNDQLNLSKELYQILVTPIKDKLDATKEIFIIPDKILFRLSFNTLFSDKYLLEEFKIAYSPSANVFLNCSRKAKEFSATKSENLLSIGNPTFDQTEYATTLQPLPSAKNEAEEVAKVYGNSTVLTENNATKDRIKENLKKADIVHFAGHYIVDENSPLLSNFVLAGSQKEKSNLANYEIIGEKLVNTRLIVLSACDTGIEKYYKGEGMIGASRTFLATGVPLVVASQWSIDSAAAKELMVHFHNLRKMKNLSTADALRQSQISMMKDEKFKQPYYWAAFVTLGGYSQF